MVLLIKIRMLIVIILGGLLIVTNGISADVPPVTPSTEKKAESVGQKELKNEGQEPAWSAEVVEPGAEPVPAPEPIPESDQPGKLIKEAKSGEDKSQTDEQVVEPESSEPAGSTSVSTEAEAEPEKDRQTEAADEAKPEEEKSQTAVQDTEPEKEVSR